MDSLAEFGVPPMAAGPCNPAVEVSSPQLPTSFADVADVYSARLLTGQDCQFRPLSSNARPALQRLAFCVKSLPQSSHLCQVSRVCQRGRVGKQLGYGDLGSEGAAGGFDREQDR